MRVTIDTKHDSLEEIRKVVALLSEMIHKQNGSSSSVLDFNLPAGNNGDTSSSGGMMNMFDLPDSGASSSKSEPMSSSEAPFGSLAGIFNTANGGAGAGSGKRSEEKDEKDAYSSSGEAKMEVY